MRSVCNNIILIAGEALNYCYGKCPQDKNICNVSCLKQLRYPKGGSVVTLVCVVAICDIVPSLFF